MRVVGGTYSGRTLVAPDGLTTRPTSDRTRQALFNILLHHDWGDAIGDPVTGQAVLDAFCGTGALGIESLSRGAARATFFDTDRKAKDATLRNIATLKLDAQAHFHTADATRPPVADQACRLIFLDPPYHKNLIPPTLAALEAKKWIAPHPLIVAETDKKETLNLDPAWRLLLSRSYGQTTVHFLTR